MLLSGFGALTLIVHPSCNQSRAPAPPTFFIEGRSEARRRTKWVKNRPEYQNVNNSGIELWIPGADRETPRITILSDVITTSGIAS